MYQLKANMKRLTQAICLLAFLFSLQIVKANNVRVVGDIKVDPLKVTPAGVAYIEFTLEWDNSWRDDYNYDAIYFFFKYRVAEGPWRHAYLKDGGHVLSGDFEYKMANSSGTADKNEGIFIQRKQNGNGRATTTLKLQWDITKNPLEPLKYDMFGQNVYYSGMGVEMVHIPRGAYNIGDNYSTKTLRYNGVAFPDKFNIMDSKYFIRSKEPVNVSYPPLNAINRVNDITNSYSNAWVGNGVTRQEWMIDFCHGKDGVTPIDGAKPRTIKYIAIEGIPDCIPGKWMLQGTDNYMLGDKNWHNVQAGTGTSEDWGSSLLQTYPPTKIIKLTNPGAYCYYRILIDSMKPAENAPVIKSIAMTDKNLDTLDYSMVIDRPNTVLDPVNGMSANDGDTWTGTTSDAYPNGYKGFYVMKYEVSQEQYVEFLNKLDYAGQKARTIGDALNGIEKNGYIFGPDRNNPSVRNGIIVASREEDPAQPVIFGCNYYKGDNQHSLDGDGQAVACNYLSVADMLAYADWSGLRPLSEMEYEKMSRRPYPSMPDAGEFAWNSKDNMSYATSLVNDGKKNEKPASGNVNALGGLTGPIRCGAFAGSGMKQPESGSSFWGVMELSGNLAEIFYGVNTAGRAFMATDVAHGDGELGAGATSTMKSMWPETPGAFVLRGGSFKSSKSEIATSDRTSTKDYFQAISRRDSTVGFRLGHSVASVNLSSILTAANGNDTKISTAKDTICSGTDYKIMGNREVGNAKFYTYIWYSSENDGRTWGIVDGENGPDLTVRRLTNTGMAAGTMKSYWFKRKVITPYGDGESNAVVVSVVDDSYTIDRLRDTVTIFDETNGIKVNTMNATKFEWINISTGRTIAPKEENSRYSYILPTRAAFIAENDKNLFGEKVVELRMTIAGTCVHNESVELYFPDAVNTDVVGIIDSYDGYKMWSDGTFAHSADEYRHPKSPYRYIGKIGSGVYRIDPDGPGPIAPFNVYCDMETDGGGWMLAGKFSNHDAKFWCANKTNWTSESVLGSYTDITTYVDAKTPVWSLCNINYMMFQTMGVPNKAFRTRQDCPLSNFTNLSDITLSGFFSEKLANFPNTSSSSCAASLNIVLLNSTYTDFPWINYVGFKKNTISIGKCDGSDTQCVISGDDCGGGEADYGLGALEDPYFGTGSSQSDVGTGGAGASATNNALLFVK